MRMTARGRTIIASFLLGIWLTLLGACAASGGWLLDKSLAELAAGHDPEDAVQMSVFVHPVDRALSTIEARTYEPFDLREYSFEEAREVAKTTGWGTLMDAAFRPRRSRAAWAVVAVQGCDAVPILLERLTTLPAGSPQRENLFFVLNAALHVPEEVPSDLRSGDGSFHSDVLKSIERTAGPDWVRGTTLMLRYFQWIPKADWWDYLDGFQPYLHDCVRVEVQKRLIAHGAAKLQDWIDSSAHLLKYAGGRHDRVHMVDCDCCN